MVRHYTDIGLLHPHINPMNGYKFYDEVDALILADVRSARSLDFSLPQIVGLQNVSLETKLEEIDARYTDLTKQIEELEEKRLRLQKIREFYDKARLCNGTVEDVKRGPIHSLYTFGAKKNYESARSLVSAWIKKLPFTHISIKLPKDELNDSHHVGVYTVELGFGVTCDYAQLVGLDLSDPVETIPGGRFLIVYLKTRNVLKLTPDDLKPLLDKAHEMGVQFLNHSSGRLLSVEQTHEGPIFSILIRVRIGD